MHFGRDLLRCLRQLRLHGLLLLADILRRVDRRVVLAHSLLPLLVNLRVGLLERVLLLNITGRLFAFEGRGRGRGRTVQRANFHNVGVIRIVGQLHGLLAWHLSAASLRYDSCCLRVDESHAVRVPELDRLWLQFRHFKRVVHERLGELPLDLEPVTGHVELEGRIRHSLSTRLVSQSLVLCLVDRSDFGEADALLLVQVHLVLVDEGVWDDELSSALLLLLEQDLIDAHLQQFKLLLLVG